MRRTQPATDETDLKGRALEVRYRNETGRPGFVAVSIAVRSVEGGPAYIRRWESILVVAEERMSEDAMHARVDAEAARREIGRVAWTRETWAGPLA